MSFDNLDNRNDYVGNGVTDTFDYGFKIFSETDLLIIVRDLADVETTLAFPTDFNVTGVGVESGGTITLIDGALTEDCHISIKRRLPLTQDTDLRNQGAYYPEDLEDQLDRLVMITQQLQEQVDRCLKFPETSDDSFNEVVSIPSANQILVVDSDGDAIGFINIDALNLSLNTSIATLQADIDAKSPVTAPVQFTIPDNQVAALSITGMIYDKTLYRSITHLCTIERRDAGQGFRETFYLTCEYDQYSDSWAVPEKITIGPGGSGPTSGVAFSQTSGGQVQLVSDSLGGGSYVGKLTWSVVYKFAKET